MSIISPANEVSQTSLCTIQSSAFVDVIIVAKIFARTGLTWELNAPFASKSTNRYDYTEGLRANCFGCWKVAAKTTLCSSVIYVRVSPGVEWSLRTSTASWWVCFGGR